MPHLRRLFLVAGALAVGCNQSAPPAQVAQTSEKIQVADVVAAPQVVVKQERPAKVEPVKVEPANVDAKPFAFPDDAGGQHLAKTLPPQSPPTLPGAGVLEPRERTLPDALSNPTPASSTASPDVPRLGLPAGKIVQPNALPERVAVDFAPTPEQPERSALATGPLTRDDGRDVTKPADLPLLSAAPVPERASLADPTTEFTAQSVISLVLPLRFDMTGFFRLVVPDPFENIAGRAGTAPVDDPNRALGNPPPPKP